MGYNFIQLFRDRVKRSWKLAFFAAFISFLLIHIYKLTNTLPNHDSIYNAYSNQDVTSSGRWFLSVACGITSYFDLPWINGLMSAVYLGITAAVVAEIFNMKNPVVIVLSATLLTACPCTTETLFFEYTADGYFLGLMLSSFSAYYSINGKTWWHYALSAICLCCSLAIYQAYISFAILLCICYLLSKLLEQPMTVKASWKWIGKHIVIYAIGMVSYYIIWKIALAVTQVTASDYQGINSVGKVGLSTLVNGAISSVKNLITWFIGWNSPQTPVTLYSVLNIIFVVAFISAVVVAISKSKVFRHKSALAMVIFCLLACIPAVSLWNFLTDGVAYRPMMLHSAIVIFVFAIVLFDRWIAVKWSSLFAVFMSVVILNFAILANIAYFYFHKCYEKSYYVGMQMMQTISEITEESQVDSIAFVGNRHEELYIIYHPPGNKAYPFSYMIERDLLYDNSHAYLFLQNTFDLDIPLIWNAQTKFADHPDVLQMNTWPAQGSAVVIDGTLVIKLSD